MLRFVPIIVNLCLVAWCVYSLSGQPSWVIIPVGMLAGMSLGKSLLDARLQWSIWRLTRHWEVMERNSK